MRPLQNRIAQRSSWNPLQSVGAHEHWNNILHALGFGGCVWIPKSSFHSAESNMRCRISNVTNFWLLSPQYNIRNIRLCRMKSDHSNITSRTYVFLRKHMRRKQMKQQRTISSWIDIKFWHLKTYVPPKKGQNRAELKTRAARPHYAAIIKIKLLLVPMKVDKDFITEEVSNYAVNSVYVSLS